MSKTITVEVTAEDIAAGRPRRCYFCPIALAVRRALRRRDTGAVMVTPEQITYHTGLVEHVHELPIEAMGFVGRFDAGEDVEPFTFELEVSGE